MPTIMTGPEFGLRELAKAIRWEVAFQKLCLRDWLVQDTAESRHWAAQCPGEFKLLCHLALDWHP
jgi:hypothetical protein